MIGDQAFHLAVADVDALEQPLRDLHRPLGREPELAAGFLRERGGGERRRRALDARLLARRRDRPRHVARARASASAAGVRFVEQARTVPISARRSSGRSPCRSRRAGRRRATSVATNSRPSPAQLRLEVPVGRRCGTPAALLRARRSAAPPRSARGRRSGPSAPSSTAPATACSRRADRGCGGSPAPHRFSFTSRGARAPR